jgi:hypothetical protein
MTAITHLLGTWAGKSKILPEDSGRIVVFLVAGAAKCHNPVSFRPWIVFDLYIIL